MEKETPASCLALVTNANIKSAEDNASLSHSMVCVDPWAPGSYIYCIFTKQMIKLDVRV